MDPINSETGVMLKSTKLKNTLLVVQLQYLYHAADKKKSKMGSYAYDAQFLKDHGIEYTGIGIC